MAKKKSTKSHTQPKPATIDLTTLPQSYDESLRLTWVDRSEFSYRKDPPVCMLRFYSGIPNLGLQEVARLQMATGHARAIVDLLCSGLDYYPEKPRAKDGKGKPKKRKPK